MLFFSLKVRKFSNCCVQKHFPIDDVQPNELAVYHVFNKNASLPMAHATLTINLFATLSMFIGL